MSAFSRLGLLLWKNFKLKFRHPFIFLFEIGIPCLFSIILVIVRNLVSFDYIATPTTYFPNPIENGELSGKMVLFAPQDPKTDKIMKMLQNIVSDLQIKGFENEDQLVDFYLHQDSNSIISGVIFKSYEFNETFDFKLRFSFAPTPIAEGFSPNQANEFTWKTGNNFPLFQKPGPRSPQSETGGPPGYYQNGFLYLQHYLCRAFVYSHNETAAAEFYNNFQLNVQRFPYPPYNNDMFLFSLQFMFPIIMMISFIYPYVNLTKNIVLEKELRLKEAMKMMGLKDWMHWSSWFIDSIIWNTISIAVITALFCIPFQKDLAIISKSNFALIFLFFFLYIVSSIMFCFFLSTFFTNANIAGIAAGAVYFVSFLPYFQVCYNYHELSIYFKTAISLIFNTNMALGCMLLSIWETNHVGLQFSNLMEPASLDDDLTFFNILIMFVIDSIIYLLAALYISNVFPGQYGIGRKWYYFVQPSYWFGTKSQTKLSNDSNDLKEIPQNCIKIKNVSKSYNQGKIKALKNLNLTMKMNEITVLLGHNGAGKTTLMSILCGLMPPSSGTIHMNGHNFERDLDEIRKSLGVCPQFDVLFHHLTVEEHLWFYCKLKNIEENKIDYQIDKMIQLLDFEKKRYNQAHTLSGGMKRKLSVGIALIGDSKIVLLDEATSGMDVSARRFIWDLLIKEKRNRIILLSTHFMEEADVLGDEIAIIENGQLKCSGSPIDLKRKYGLGYLLTFAVKEDVVDVSLLENLIKSHIHHAKVLTSIGREITFSLPEAQSHKFETLFSRIEQNFEKLGIINYGISITTLEEVFLRVGEFSKQGTEQMNSFYEKPNNQKDSVSVDIQKNSIINNIKPNSLKLNNGFNHHGQVFYGLFIKKILFIYRNIFSLVAQFFVPGLLLSASLLINKNQMDKSANSPPLEMNLNAFHKILSSTFRDPSEQSSQLSNIYKEILAKDVDNMIFKDLTFNDSRISNNSLEYLLDFGTKYEDQYNLYYLLAAMFTQDGIDNKMTITAMFNNQAYHASSLSVAYIDKTIFSYILNNEKFRLSIWNDPLPRKHSDNLGALVFDSTLQIQLCNNLQFAMSFLLASFIIFLVKEKTTNFKHIQRISGLNMFQYWLINFLLDFTTYLLSSLILCLIIYLLNTNTFTFLEQQIRLLVIFVAHGLSSIPMVYVFSLYFRDAATAYVRLSLYLLIMGTTTFLVVVILQLPDLKLQYLSDIFNLVFAFILPIFNLAMSVFSISQNTVALDLCLSNITLIGNLSMNVQDLCNFAFDTMKELQVCCPGKCGDQCFKFNKNYFGMEKLGIGINMLAFSFQIIIFWIILYLIESNSFRKLLSFNKSQNKAIIKIDNNNNNEEEDYESDVENEKKRVNAKNSEINSMVVQNVRKNYGDFPAVRNISFGVQRGECFGILGENGAGKTTLFKMITGDETITSGNIIINCHDVQKEMHQVYKDIGYCPQFDGLIDHLTGRETLKVISRIRGLQEILIDQQIDAISQMLFFQKHIDHKVKSYSGGTKRKLSFAISIVGNPLITFLDEPTTGVDPVSRRCLWNAIHMVRSAGSSLVLTSHSMEECEALCNRLMIMVHGKITCLGSPMHLKQKYGAGYMVHIKLNITDHNSLQESLPKLNRFMNETFPNCRLDSTHNNSLVYKIQTNQIALSYLFGKIENNKIELNIEDYSICQTSLERIFLSFVRKQLQF